MTITDYGIEHGKLKTFFALNRKTKQATILPGFSCWEDVQMAFRWGIRLPNGTNADGIGRCISPAAFIEKANHSNFQVILECGCDRWLCVHGNGAMA